MPKVSIITGAYNHVRFVRHSVESALNQTYRDFEHIVVDDGTTDGTAEVLESFGNQIKYIRQENRGAYAAKNAGIRASSGEYIALLDSDDAWAPQKLARQMQAFDRSPNAGMVYSPAQVIDADGRVDPVHLIGDPLDQARPFEDILIKTNRIPVLTAVIRRSCLDDVGSFVENLEALADWELWLRISTRWPIVFVSEPLAFYRVHGRNSYHRLVENGRVIREQLLVLKNTAAGTFGDPHELKRRKRALEVMYTFTTLQQSYGLACRGRRVKALSYLLFALRHRPALVKDLAAAVRLEPELFTGTKPRDLLTKLIFGEREVGDGASLLSKVDSPT